jgi:uncharacterized protein YjiS (DUF1127 family)
MNFIRAISAKRDAWRRYREIVSELSRFSDAELNDIGLRRVDIGRVARECAAS